MPFLKQVQSSAYLFAFSLLYSLDVFLSRPRWVCVSCVSALISVLLVAPLEGVETPRAVGRAAASHPFPSMTRGWSGLSGREPVQDGRKAAFWHAAVYGQGFFCYFSFRVRGQIQSSK